METKASQWGHYQAKNIIIHLIASVEDLLQMFGTSCIQIIAESFFLLFASHLYQSEFGQIILGSSCWACDLKDLVVLPNPVRLRVWKDSEILTLMRKILRAAATLAALHCTVGWWYQWKEGHKNFWTFSLIWFIGRYVRWRLHPCSSLHRYIPDRFVEAEKTYFDFPFQFHCKL